MSYDGKKRPATGRISHANARMLYELVWIGAGCVVIGWLGGWLNLDALWPGLAAAQLRGGALVLVCDAEHPQGARARCARSSLTR
jgi:hypothetical protein